jgi:hypothetical protein
MAGIATDFSVVDDSSPGCGQAQRENATPDGGGTGVFHGKKRGIAQLGGPQ